MMLSVITSPVKPRRGASPGGAEAASVPTATAVHRVPHKNMEPRHWFTYRHSTPRMPENMNSTASKKTLQPNQAKYLAN
jgi:hypothetical protein